ncbi:Aldehyde dehydrogenase domain protein [Niveomyces insectorum RCEF 264]|uniref:aldehyde dehydrogenase (NAD(+)) n=1 Tax=Niveomyces insectorum RCEF 264 TaxID=1081102 RepID=A0A162IH66_9HYPO|nr:Aldehyde dehydrogenase domain protein [Niveomyces insectorum RCEF 264]
MVVTSQPRLLINGKLVEASDKKTFPLYNPATREKVADVPEASEDDANAAVAAAKDAFPAWSALDPSQRAGYFKTLANLIRENSDKLAKLEAVSMGRPVDGYFDAMAAAGHFDHYAEAWPHIQGQASLNTPGFVTMTLRQPVGVVAAIIPWNVPLLFLASKSAPAMIAGNTVVLKSSEKAPLTSALVAELVLEAGFPPGVFNILSGHGVPSGAVLASHMDVRALSFTGSGRTGRLIQEMAAKSNLKKVTLELGGKSPALIFADADMDRAVEETVNSIQWNSGQVCMANSRIYVEKGAAEAFAEAFTHRFTQVKPGNPLETGVNHGPQADEVQYKAVTGFIEEGKTSGGTLLLGGKGTLETTGGYFVEPTVFFNTPEEARIMRDEVFGPVVNISVFDTEAKAIALANDTEYGLYASVYTRDISRALRIAKALENGHVGVNCTSPASGRDLPFGGYKASGQGREGWLHSLDNFLETKSVVIKVDDA